MANFTHPHSPATWDVEIVCGGKILKNRCVQHDMPPLPHPLANKVHRTIQLCRKLVPRRSETVWVAVTLQQRFGISITSHSQLQCLAPKCVSVKLHVVLHIAGVDFEVVGLWCIRGLTQARRSVLDSIVCVPNHVPICSTGNPAQTTLRVPCRRLVGRHHLVRNVAV